MKNRPFLTQTARDVDTLGLLLAVKITTAAVQDRDAARTLIQGLVSLFQHLQIIWADGGYLGALVQWVKNLRPYGNHIPNTFRSPLRSSAS